MPLKTSSFVIAGSAAAIFMLAGAAHAAPIPSCHGHDAKAAATAKAEGLKHYRRSKREGASDAEMIAALGFFDASCAAGDDSVLELRAYALAGLERYVEAAETLDAFLTVHPVASLPPDIQARIAAQEPDMLARIASLSIDSTPEGAEVTVNHRVVGTTPVQHLRLDPGKYDVSVRLEAGASVSRTVDLAAGEAHEVFPLEGAPVVAAPPKNTAPADSSNASGYRTYVIGSGAAAGAFLLGGIAGAIWANERSNVYNAANCDGTNKQGCASTLSQYNGARDLEIVGFVGAGVFAITGGTLFYLDLKRAQTHPKAESLGSVDCGVAGRGMFCRGTF